MGATLKRGEVGESFSSVDKIKLSFAKIVKESKVVSAGFVQRF